MRVFPLWADRLELPTRELRGHDVALDAPDDVYRDLIRQIKDDATHLGALVTTHKLRVYAAARDLFDDLDEFSRQCGEISSISKHGGRLHGSAKDPQTAGFALDEILSGTWFGRGGEVVCLGAGGSGTAISTRLAQRRDLPRRITVTDVNQAQLDHVRDVHARAGLAPELFRYVLVDSAAEASVIVGGVPERSLVVNASGLGKDRPGSPTTSELIYPRSCAVWEINYRGSLEFLHHAQAQAAERGLLVVDGWRYFIHGWTQVVAEVFAISMRPEVVEELAAIAASVR